MIVDRGKLLGTMCHVLLLVQSNSSPLATDNPCDLASAAYSVDVNDTASSNETTDFEKPCLELSGLTTMPGIAGKNEGVPDACTDRFCIPLCCPLGNLLIRNRCVPEATNGSFLFPEVYDAKTLTLTTTTVTEGNFSLFVRDPCDGGQRYKLSPLDYEEDEFKLLGNGSIYQTNYKKIVGPADYCFGLVENSTYDVILCFESEAEVQKKIAVAFPIGLIISVPFLLGTFLVYSLIPDLKNMHGRTLRGYVGSLLAAYILLAIIQTSPQQHISDPVCVAFAFTIHFSFLASFFWLNVMCFDIWWTFGGFRSLQGSVKQRERKKFLLYSIYAWGSASILTGVCAVMDFAPNVPEHFIRPQFGVESCWFTTDAAKAIYFYGPMGVTVFCNICLFISTALKILQHKKDTAHHLKGLDSKRHDDNKQWFNLYLKLFIVMGINWSMEIVSWLCKDTPEYVWYITDLTNTLQGVIIFLIFVWKDKIKRLLLRRLGCKDRDILSRNSTRSVYHSSASRTCTTSAPLQEKINPYLTDAACRNRGPLDESDYA